MIVFNCTKAAVKYLFPKNGLESTVPVHEIQSVPDFPIDYKGEKLQPVTQWLVTHTKFGKDDILFVCHATHRYTISLFNIEKGDVESFLFIVHGRIMAQFACWTEQMPFDMPLRIHQWMENYFDAHEGMYFCQRWNSSIQHSINIVNAGLDSYFYTFGQLPKNQEEATLFDIDQNLRLEHRAKIKRDIIPTNELFSDFITHYMGIKKTDIMSCRAETDNFFKEIIQNRFAPSTEEDDQWIEDMPLADIEAEHQALLNAGDSENAAIFEALIKFKKTQDKL